MVLVARWFLTLCPISSQFGKPAYLGRLKDRARLQMVFEMDISETTLRSADIPSRVFHGVHIAFSRRISSSQLAAGSETNFGCRP
jgi:hypothetical protein